MIRVIILSLLLTGCVATHVAHITSPIDDGIRPTVTVCTTGKDRPDLDQVIVEWHDMIGVDVQFNDLPEREAYPDVYRYHEYDDGARERAALRYASVIPECQIVVEYIGGGGACTAAAILMGGICVNGGMYFRPNKLDAAGFIRLLGPGTLKHELSHAWGCQHDWDEATCRAQIAYMKAQL